MRERQGYPLRALASAPCRGVARIRLRGHLDFIAVHRADVVDGRAVERHIKGEVVAIDFAVAYFDGVALRSLHRACDLVGVLLEGEAELEVIAVGGLHLRGPGLGAGDVGGQRGCRGNVMARAAQIQRSCFIGSSQLFAWRTR